ncbi:MAG TPA: hypothetical protein VK059_04540 [Nocardioidaceae bacterium]|nr:hypothetical protein [Nocardioidaceae bacterium]
MIEWGHKSAGAVHVLQGDSVVAEVRASSFRERADVAIGAAQWEYFKRSGTLHGVSQGHAGRLSASRQSMFRQGWQVEAGAQAYLIRPEGFFQSRYRVERAGVSIGESRKAGFWSNRPTLDVDADVPLEHQVFLLWIAFIMRRRAAGAAAGASAS